MRQQSLELKSLERSFLELNNWVCMQMLFISSSCSLSLSLFGNPKLSYSLPFLSLKYIYHKASPRYCQAIEFTHTLKTLLLSLSLHLNLQIVSCFILSEVFSWLHSLSTPMGMAVAKTPYPCCMSSSSTLDNGIIQ